MKTVVFVHTDSRETITLLNRSFIRRRTKMAIQISKASVFPQLHASQDYRDEAFDWVHRESYRTGSIILPPRESEFFYVWSRFILPNSLIVNKGDNYRQTYENLVKKYELKDVVKFVEDHDLTNQIVCSAIVAGYNIITTIRNQHINESSNSVYKFADFVMPLFNHNNEPEAAANEMHRIREFSHSLILKLGSKIILDIKELLSRDNKTSFWELLFNIQNVLKMAYSIGDYRRRVIEGKQIYTWDESEKNFILDEYQNRSDSGLEISKAQIISMLENTSPSTKTLISIQEALKQCQK